MKKPMLTLVVAMNYEHVMGVNNQLPWHIKEDLNHFKQVTWGKPIIMGRKTFDSIGKVLPGRTNIVITRNLMWQHSKVAVYHTLSQAIKDNQQYPELCIIGGGEIFAQALPLADKMHITWVNLSVNNPTVFFPPVDFSQWRLIKQQKIITSNNIECCFNELVKQGVKGAKE